MLRLLQTQERRESSLSTRLTMSSAKLQHVSLGMVSFRLIQTATELEYPQVKFILSQACRCRHLGMQVVKVWCGMEIMVALHPSPSSQNPKSFLQRHGGFLDGLEFFDAVHFGMSATEAELDGPLALGCAYVVVS